MASRPEDRRLRIAFAIGFVVGFAFLTVSFLVVWDGGTYSVLPDRQGATWVSTDPIQCLYNPWERDWLESNNETAGSYPRGWEARRSIIIDYYEGLGMHVFDVRHSDRGRDFITCGACGCPAGYTLFVQVADEDVDDMVALGFRIVS